MLTPLRPCPKAFVEGTIHLLQGDKAKAQDSIRTGPRGLGTVAARSARRPGKTRATWAYPCGLGSKSRKPSPKASARSNCYPNLEDAFDGPQFTASLAQIYAWTGETDEAFRLLDHLLVVPNGLTVPILKLDPAWDPLRKDPRFQALIDKYSPKT